jgi:acetolactate synthase I/II/III large subunit
VEFVADGKTREPIDPARICRLYGMGGFQLLPVYDASRRLGQASPQRRASRHLRGGRLRHGVGPGRACRRDPRIGATNLVTGRVEARNAGILMWCS